MQLPVYKRDGSTSSETVEIPDDLLAGDPNDHAIWLAVRSEEAARRQGTAATRNRSMVRGGGRKPFRQKGRGVARQGTTRSPLNPGGGTIFGPQPHAYSVKISDKVKRLARRSALIHKAREERIRVIEDFALSTPRTHDVVDVLSALGLKEEKVLLVTPEFDVVMARSIRNLNRTHVQKAEAASARDLMDCTILLFLKSAVPRMVKVLDHAV